MFRAAIGSGSFAPSSLHRRPARAVRGGGRSGVEPLESRVLFSSGDLDPTFGVGGMVSTDIPGSSGNRVARDIALQSDGKILQVAWHGGFGAVEPVLAVTRFNPDGSLDTTFGDDGLRVIDYPDRGEIFGSLAVGPNDEIVIGTWATSPTTDLLAADSDVLVARLNPDGTFDTHFGQGGYALVDIGRAVGGPAAAKTTDFVFDVAVQADGKVVTAGSVNIPQGRFGLVRFNTNGSLDTTFGTGGAVVAPFANNTSTANSLDIDNSGRIVVVGTTGVLTGSPPRINDQDWAVARYLPDGSLDPTFGAGGWTVTSFGTGTDTPFRIEATPDGKIVASGSTTQTTTAVDMAVARYNANGSPDLGFSGDGKATFSNTVVNNTGQTVQASEEAEGLAVLADGSVLVSGRSGIGISQTNAQVILVRLTPSGAPAAFFGNAGKVIVPELDEASAIAVQPADGNIVVGGHYVSDTSGFEDFALVRFDPFGNIDFGFGPSGNGVTIADFPATGFNSGLAGVLQPDGKVVVGGLTIVTNSNLRDIAFARYNIDGTLDATFGQGGIVQIDLLPAYGSDVNEGIAAMTLDADGNIVWVGVMNDPSSNSQDILVGRLLPDGSTDTSFAGGAGIMRIGSVAGVPTAHESARDVLVQPDGRIVVVGDYSTSSTSHQFLVVRLDPFGSFDRSFNGTGAVRTQFTGVTDSWANAVALAPDQDGVGSDIVVAGRALQGGSDRFAFVRLNEDGVPDFGFGIGGQVTTLVSGTSGAVANDVLVDDAGRILAGGTARGQGDDFVLMRYNAAGALDSTFDGDGIVLTDFEAGARANDALNSLAFLPGGAILAGGTNANNMVAARYSDTGALDTSFASAGRAVIDFETGFYPSAPQVSRDSAAEVFVYPGDRAVLLGSSYSPRTGSDFAAARITLSGPPNAFPVASAGGPYVMTEGSGPLTLSAAGSSDADGTIIKYEWDLSYENFAGFLVEARGASVDFPNQPDEGTGTRRVALRVTDDNNVSHTTIFNITVTNAVPTINPIADATTSPGQAFTAAGSFTDPGTQDTFSATVNWGEGGTVALPLNADKTFALNHVYANPGTYNVVVTVRDNDGGTDTEEIVVTVRGDENHVTGRQVFYRGSAFDDGANPLAAAPGNKQALLPGATATIANLTNYTRGLNGLIVTLDGAAGGTVDASDFRFKTGAGGDPATWADAPQPTGVEVTPIAGGGTRVVLTWADGAIRNTWLQTTVLANADTKLLTNDVFYYGNLAGDGAFTVGRVDGADYIRARLDSARGTATITSDTDVNHDGRVNMTDLVAIRRFAGQSIELISAPAVAVAPASASSRLAPPVSRRQESRPPRRSVLDATEPGLLG